MAGRGATLVLRASWFNRSSWIRAKKIIAIRVYGCRALTSPRIFGFRPSMKKNPDMSGTTTDIGSTTVDVDSTIVESYLENRYRWFNHRPGGLTVAYCPDS
ncbi:hypothetical protein BHM03_00047887 [Ensete ventricosum]|nr:hypothetical protein BHM03_00047887 [Ensete ventricosum]